MQIVVFELAGEKYALESSKVQGINRMMDITEVPNAPSYIKGLVNLRGSIISIIDPYQVLGVNNQDKNCEDIMIIGTDDEILGIIVDKVVEVMEIDNQLIKSIPALKEEDRAYAKGVINMEGYLITLIDIDVLLDFK
jgi:Chemotaxis signal transduction protein